MSDATTIVEPVATLFKSVHEAALRAEEYMRRATAAGGLGLASLNAVPHSSTMGLVARASTGSNLKLARYSNSSCFGQAEVLNGMMEDIGRLTIERLLTELKRLREIMDEMHDCGLHVPVEDQLRVSTLEKAVTGMVKPPKLQ